MRLCWGHPVHRVPTWPSTDSSVSSYKMELGVEIRQPWRVHYLREVLAVSWSFFIHYVADINTDQYTGHFVWGSEWVSGSAFLKLVYRPSFSSHTPSSSSLSSKALLALDKKTWSHNRNQMKKGHKWTVHVVSASNFLSLSNKRAVVVSVLLSERGTGMSAVPQNSQRTGRHKQRAKFRLTITHTPRQIQTGVCTGPF